MFQKEFDLLAVLKVKAEFILGKVLTLGPHELVFQSFSNIEIPLESLQFMDVFNKEQIHFRNLAVRIISDSKIQSEKSFSKMIIRRIKVSFNDSQFTNLLPNILNSYTY